jgi:hypothetical protein
LFLCVASAADSQSPKWDLVCRYGNGSSAFEVSYAQHKASGDMVSDQLVVGSGQITFDVSAARTTLLQDFHVTIDRASLKWTANKPGWGGTCQKP